MQASDVMAELVAKAGAAATAAAAAPAAGAAAARRAAAAAAAAVPKLAELFRIGQLVRCMVVGKEGAAEGARCLPQGHASAWLGDSSNVRHPVRCTVVGKEGAAEGVNRPSAL